MAKLQPVVLLDQELVTMLVRFADSLTMRQGSNQFRHMSVIVNGEHAILNPVPAGGLFGLVSSNKVQAEIGGAAGCVHGEVGANFPFEEADFVGCAEPALLEEGREEDGAVDVMHVLQWISGRSEVRVGPTHKKVVLDHTVRSLGGSSVISDGVGHFSILQLQFFRLDMDLSSVESQAPCSSRDDTLRQFIAI